MGSKLRTDSDYIVTGDVKIRESFPLIRQDIFKEYMTRIDALSTEGGSFAYMENQYFTDYLITQNLFKAWQEIFRDAGFAYIVIPYKPGTFWFDLFGKLAKDKIIKQEYQCLKWLEIKTARKIFELDGLKWKHTFDISDPKQLIEFNIQPKKMPNPSSKAFKKLKFKVDECWDVEKREFVYNKEFYVKDVLTESDIMAFTLVSTHKGGQSKERLKVKIGTNVKKTSHRYLNNNGIYIHSKASFFREGEDENATYWATIGSANLNNRSLTGDQSGYQDSEMNVFWSHNGEKDNKIIEFWANLWGEHAGCGFNPSSFRENAWENLIDIQLSGKAKHHIVRLDVVERYLRLV
jgi:hypothetical protein